MKKISGTCNARERLEELVQEAENLIELFGEKKGVRAKAALVDMVERAKKALDGEKFPFTCQREFWTRTEDDEIQFALQHYTMVPSFLCGGKNYGVYGLEEAVRWYQNLGRCEEQKTGSIQLNINEVIDGSFFLGGSEIREVRDKIKQNASFKEQYEEIEKIADSASLEELKYKYRMNLQNAGFAGLGEKLNLWRQSGNGANFAVPKAAVKAVVNISLPSEENAEDGLGDIWIKNMRLHAESGDVIAVKHNCMAENFVIYLQNLHRSDRAEWESEKISISGGMSYSLMFESMQKGKFKSGVRIAVISYNELDEEIDRYEYAYNHKSWIPVDNYNLSMQCNAIVYMVNGNVSYAEKAKIQMLHMMDDFCQGAYYWMTYNERPEGLDCYGAVQAGRNLCSLAVTYALIEDAEVFSCDEKRLFYKLVDFMLHYCLDLRDRTQMSCEEVQRGTGNWQTDMCIGVSLMMFALKDFPNRRVWIENAYAVVYGQLMTNLNHDGSWPESIRYHHAVLERFATYAKALKRVTGINWFRDTRLLDMFSYGIDIQTPAYAYFDNCISTPPFGDHKLGAGEEFAVYGLYLKEAAEENRALADRMYLTWVASGRKKKGLWGESITLENFLYPVDYKPQAVSELKLTSTDTYKDAGIYIFRSSHKNGKADYMAVMSSGKKIGHGHLDQGSFILYKDNVPVIMDSGIEGYFDVSTPWHISSYSHACMLFKTTKAEKASHLGFINLSAGNFTREQGYLDTPECSSVISCNMGERMESLQMMIYYEACHAKHIRQFEADALKRIWRIRDRIEGYKGEILFSLPLVAQKVDITDSHIHVDGYYKVTLDINVLSVYKTMTVDEGRTSPVCPSGEGQHYLKYLRIRADAGDGFFVEIK